MVVFQWAIACSCADGSISRPRTEDAPSCFAVIIDVAEPQVGSRTREEESTNIRKKCDKTLIGFCDRCVKVARGAATERATGFTILRSPKESTIAVS